MKKNNDKIIKNYRSKINILKKNNKLYYQDERPIISDRDYDLLKKEIIELEKSNNFLKKLGSIESIIGSKPSNNFKKIKHLKPMLSLSNAFNQDDMKDFINEALVSRYWSVQCYGVNWIFFGEA